MVAAGSVNYSPDGKRLAYLSQLNEKDFTGAKLWVKNVHDGTPRLLVSGGSLQWPRWSPDGTRIAYANGSSVYIVSVATGDRATRRGLGPVPRRTGPLNLDPRTGR